MTILHKHDAIKYIASIMRMTEKNILVRVMRRKDFPKPIKQIGHYAVYNKESIDKFLGIDSGIYANFTHNSSEHSPEAV